MKKNLLYSIGASDSFALIQLVPDLMVLGEVLREKSSFAEKVQKTSQRLKLTWTLVSLGLYLKPMTC